MERVHGEDDVAKLHSIIAKLSNRSTLTEAESKLIEVIKARLRLESALLAAKTDPGLVNTSGPSPNAEKEIEYPLLHDLEIGRRTLNALIHIGRSSIIDIACLTKEELYGGGNGIGIVTRGEIIDVLKAHGLTYGMTLETAKAAFKKK